MYVNVNNAELLGIGIGWQNKVIPYMRKRLRMFPEVKLVTHRMINNLQREYMSLQASGYTAADIVSGTGDIVKWNKQTYKMSRIMADRLNVSSLFVLNYFLALYNLSKTGKIPYQRWNPKGYIKSKKLQKKIPTEKTILEKVGKGFRFGLPLVALIGIAAGVFLLKDKI